MVNYGENRLKIKKRSIFITIFLYYY